MGGLMAKDPNELVMAGSVPTAHSKHPLEALHRQISFVMIGTIFLFALFVWSILNGISSGFGWVAILPCIILGMIWSGFRNRREWAYPFAVALNAAAIVLFGLMSIIFLMSGDVLSVLLGILLLFTAIASTRRLNIMRNTLFKAWYLGMEIPMYGMNLQQGEIYASCPHCSSILAIKPVLLSQDEQCPSCGEKLVSEETALRVKEEE
jgi:hypothetical protein